jgi:hypothetical protein
MTRHLSQMTFTDALTFIFGLLMLAAAPVNRCFNALPALNSHFCGSFQGISATSQDFKSDWGW